MMGLQALMRSCHAGHDGDNASNPMMALPPRAPAEVTCAICRPLLLGAYLLNFSRQPTVWPEILGPESLSRFPTHRQRSRRHLLIGLKVWTGFGVSLLCVQQDRKSTRLNSSHS